MSSIQRNGGSNTGNSFPNCLNYTCVLTVFQQRHAQPREHLVEPQIHSQQKEIENINYLTLVSNMYRKD